MRQRAWFALTDTSPTMSSASLPTCAPLLARVARDVSCPLCERLAVKLVLGLPAQPQVVLQQTGVMPHHLQDSRVRGAP